MVNNIYGVTYEYPQREYDTSDYFVVTFTPNLVLVFCEYHEKY